MANTAQNLMTGLAFTATLFTAGQALAAQNTEATIILHVDNYAGIAREDLEWAEAEATRIYAAAGVRTVWSLGTRKPPPPGCMRVLLLSRDMATRKIRTDRVANGALGQAARPTGRAYIFTHRVTEVGLRYSHYFSWVLGQVIAHEVGHLV